MKNELLRYLQKLDELLSDFGIKKYDYVFEIEYKQIEDTVISDVMTYKDGILFIDNFIKKSIDKEILYLETDEVSNTHQEYINELKKVRGSYEC